MGESSKIFVEHALYVARKQFRNQVLNGRVPNGAAGPDMIICLSINRRMQSKNQFDERKQD